MERIDCRRRLAVLAAACGIAWAGGVRADAGDAFNFLVGQSVMRDDNIFRLPGGADAQTLIGSGERGDTVSTTYAGVYFDKLAGRQRLRASLNASHVRYGRFSRLDYDGTDLKGGWNWELGNRWRGEIAYSRSEVLTDFGDFRSPVKNVNIYQRLSYGANYEFHPDWSVGANVFRVRSDNSSPLRETGKYEADGAEAVVQFTPRGENYGALRLRRTDGAYPNREVTPGGLVDNSYRQDEIEGSLGWRPTWASRLDARIAGVRRSHDQVPVRDFSGATGRLSWDWLMIGSTRFNITARREIGAQDDILSSYVVTRGISLSPTWMPTARTSVQATLERRVRNYRGDPVAILSGIEKREDRLRVASLSASYAPATSLQFSVTLRREQRESNYAGLPYRANAAFANAQFSF